MEIFKPTAERESQKKSRNRKPRSRGAVINQPAKTKKIKTLSFTKRVSDFFKNIARINAFKNSWLIVALLAICSITLSGYALRSVKTEMPIEKVFVKGDFYQIDKRELELALEPLVGSNYLDVNIKNIKSNLMNFAWVQSVEVRKVWPASLEVNVLENQAIATWGEDGFVNEFGKVFKPENVNKALLVGLPDLNGLDKQSDLVLSTYVQLSELSRRSDLKITHFSLVANSYWRLQFDQGSEILLTKGREWQSLNTFLLAYQQNFKDSQHQLAKVDMRYNNGFSVEFGEEINIEVGLEQNEQEIDLNDKNQQKIKSIVNVGKHHG